MGNIITYLEWRGEFDFSERPFCIVDNLALALLSYIDFMDAVPNGQDKIELRQVYERLAPLGIKTTGAFTGLDEMLKLMAQSKRFGSARLSGYRTEYDDKTATQFAAVRVLLPDGSIYVAYRGTDASIAGWQEDFSIGSQIVPSQRIAVNYLNEVEHGDSSVRVGGHSKGGNLAMYAAMFCKQEIRDRVVAVYNNDGPGFCKEIVPVETYETIADRLYWIVPGFSIIGTLFPYKGATMIVQSSGSSFMQHDAMSWEIEGDSFCLREEPEKESLLYVQTFDTWITSADMKQREVFTRDFFDALRAGGAKNFSELRADGIDGYGTILMSIVQSESRTKIMIGKLVASFFHNCRSIRILEALKKRQTITGGILILGGLLLMTFPEAARQLLGSIVGVAAVIYGARKLFVCAMNENMEAGQKKKRILTWLLLICLAELVTVNQSISVLSTRLILSALLFGFAGRSVYLLAKRSKVSLVEKIVTVTLSLYAITLAIVTLMSSGMERTVIFIIGSLAIVIGIIAALHSIYDLGKTNLMRG